MPGPAYPRGHFSLHQSRRRPPLPQDQDKASQLKEVKGDTIHKETTLMKDWQFIAKDLSQAHAA